MRARLRQVGNSIGLIVPAHELRTISARAGDVVDLEIRSVVRGARSGWNDPSRWAGAAEEPLLLAGASETVFDDGEWEWVGVPRFSVWRVDLNPTRGSEQAGYRPVLVVSPDEMNANLNTVIVAPLNTRLRGWPTRVRVEHDAEIRQTTGLDVASQNDSRMEFGLAEVQPSIPASRFA